MLKKKAAYFEKANEFGGEVSDMGVVTISKKTSAKRKKFKFSHYTALLDYQQWSVLLYKDLLHFD